MDGEQTPNRNWLWVAATAVAVLAVVAVFYVPVFIVEHVDGADSSSPEGFKHLADTRSTIVQLLGGLGAAVTIYFTWRNFVRSSSEAAYARRQSLDARIANDYLRAIEQLGHGSTAVRAGGALGLGRLLHAVEVGSTDYWAIMDVLTTFIRDRAAIETAISNRLRPDRDVEAAINSLARRTAKIVPRRNEDSPVDLSGCDLTGVWLAGAKFAGAYFGGSRLVDANLDDADLCEAWFDRSDLRGASFHRASLSGTNFMTAKNVEAADFADATDLELARFTVEQRAAIPEQKQAY